MEENGTIGPVTSIVHGVYLLVQLSIRHLSLAARPSPPRVVSTTRDSQHPAHTTDRELVPIVVDDLKDHLACREKMATASLHNPGHGDHRFRSMSSTCSGLCRPPVPTRGRPLFGPHRNGWTSSFRLAGRSDRHTHRRRAPITIQDVGSATDRGTVIMVKDSLHFGQGLRSREPMAEVILALNSQIDRLRGYSSRGTPGRVAGGAYAGPRPRSNSR